MQRFCSIFSQLLQLFPRLQFEQAVRDHKGEYQARGFTCWGQFVAMLFCQLGRAHSLREICGGLASCEGKLKHFGVPDAPKKSTLAYANEHRSWSLYQTIFQQLLAKCHAAVAGRGQKKKFRFKNKLVSLDSSVIDLSVSLFDWAKFRRTAIARSHEARLAQCALGRIRNQLLHPLERVRACLASHSRELKVACRFQLSKRLQAAIPLLLAARVS